MTRPCLVEGCDRPVYGHGMCNGHYHRWKRHGDVQASVPLRTNAEKGALAAWIASHASIVTTECVLWPYAVNRFGYGKMTVEGRTTGAHRIMCEAAHGDRPSHRHEVAHSCGVRLCCNPAHLRWATSKENAADRDLHGTATKGVRNGRAKLTEDDVRAIRRLRGKVRQVDLAKRFGLDQANISAIQLGKFWQHVR